MSDVFLCFGCAVEAEYQFLQVVHDKDAEQGNGDHAHDIDSCVERIGRKRKGRKDLADEDL